MLISEKQKNLSWQVKTKEGMYYQPESLSAFYQWIFENRLCVDDFVFSARDNDWTQIINVPELKGCFWQLLTNGDVIYGPISIGEMKQLFINNQLTSMDKVAVFGREGWVKINEIDLLHNWLQTKESSGIDYIQFIDKLTEEFELRGHPPKEDKIAKRIGAVEQQNKENKKLIKELETAKNGLEEELMHKEKELEVTLGDRDKINNGFKSLQGELETLQAELKGETLLLEELNKNIAQAEVNITLKDTEINDLRSNLASVQEELEKVQNENMQSRQLVPDAIKSLENTISGKERLLEESKNTINELVTKNRDIEQKIISLGDLILEKDRAIEEANANIEGLGIAIREKEDKIANLNQIVSNKEENINGYRESIAKLQGELAERDREIAGVKDVDTEVSELANEINNYRQEIDRLNIVIAEKDANVSQIDGERLKLNDEINELKRNLLVLKEEYSAKIKEWEESVNIQKAEYEKELSEKTKLWEEAIKQEKERWEKSMQDLEGGLAQKDAQIESQKLEIERMQDALISQDKRWQERFKTAKEEQDRLYDELEKERDNLRIELTQNINGLISERDAIQAQFSDLEKSHEQIAQRENKLREDLLDRERFIEQIKDEAKRQKESYLAQLRDTEQRINKELDNTKQIVNQLQKEKDSIILELEANKVKFIEVKSQMEHELEEAKRSLEHTEEENKTLQRQFYLEKQKLTKEYTETINKQEKLQKRSQLEREIQDRAKMKDELERLYNLIKENFEGLQRGAGEIQSSLQSLAEDIDNKRLSLKYLNETGKREDKKNKFSPTEPTEESNNPS